MNLAQIRQQFVELSGRTDLVVDLDDYEDNGANWFIQAGQRFLDMLPFEFTQKEATWPGTLESGEYRLIVPQLRVVHDVWVSNGTKRWRLTPTQLNFIRKYYEPEGALPSLSNGTPSLYALMSVRDIADVNAGNEVGRGLYIYPPADTSLGIEVIGYFFSAPLVEDTDESFWSISFPETLIQAAWYMLERFYRNREGMADHLDAIMRDIQGIDFDAAEQAAELVTGIGDTWKHYGVR